MFYDRDVCYKNWDLKLMFYFDFQNFGGNSILGFEKLDSLTPNTSKRLWLHVHLKLFYKGNG